MAAAVPPTSDDDAPLGRAAIDAPASGVTRARAGWALAIFVAIQILIPLRYYLGDDVYDERFAWRMFSRVRVQVCAVEARQDGRVIAILGSGPSAPGILPAPWHSLMTRNRPAVIHRFLRWRCASEAAPERVVVTTTCQDANGEMLPPIEREIACESGAITETGAPE